VQALQALAAPLPHHGRESWLLFVQDKAVGRGLWPAPVEHALSARR
jgi:hypothetical protein